MRKSALRFLILTVLFQVALRTLFGHNVYVDQKMTWSEARQYCRERHTDLASVNTLEEIEALFPPEAEKADQNDDDDTSASVQASAALQEGLGLLKIWIGLYKNVNDMWKWSGGKNVSNYYWPSLPDTDISNMCMVITKTHWQLEDCDKTKFTFFCFESHLVLVKEKKTWQEAMEHCRNLDTELVSLPFESALIQALQTSSTAQTGRVWIGLRYLADTWLWMDGSTVEDKPWSQMKMPECPAWSHYCGALSPKGKNLDSWDCADRFNFLCF